MLVRLAVFEGKIREGQEQAFRNYVDSRLAPLWRQFDGASEVRVLHAVENDASGPDYPLILAITYPDRTAMERALASPARYESRDLLPELFERYFDGRMHHHLMSVE